VPCCRRFRGRGAIGLGPGTLRQLPTVRPACDPAGVRPALRPGLLPLWRDRDTIQIGVDPRRAVALTGAGAAAAMIGLLDGSRDREQLVTAATELGVPVTVAEQVLTLLAAAGLLIDFPAGLLRTLPLELRPQLLPELAAASLARQDADGGAQVLRRRAAASVRVLGTGRIPAAITEVLAASGVPVTLLAPPDRRAPDRTPPGRPAPGLSPADRLRPDRAPPDRRPSAGPPTLVVLAGQLPDPAARMRRFPHLAVSASEAIGTVGPLVRPGVSACLRCLDLRRADRDPAWPLILAQLARRQADPVACDAALAAAVAAQAAAQALHFIDQPGATAPAESATLELVQPGWEWRRRIWPPHPSCACRASERGRPPGG
jgi:bacteriocin biosynthesis cyclodehydratase domain-containing protein